MVFGIGSATGTCFAANLASSVKWNRGEIVDAGRREPRAAAGNCHLRLGLRWLARNHAYAVDHWGRGLVRSWCMRPKEIAHVEVERRLLGCRGDPLGRRWPHFRWRCQFLRPGGWNPASHCCLVIGVLCLGNGPSLGGWGRLFLRTRLHRDQTRPIVGFPAKSFLFEADKPIFMPYLPAAYSYQLELYSCLVPHSQMSPNS